MKSISKDGVQYAIVHRKDEWQDGLDFLTPDEAFCQVGTWVYSEGKKLPAHKHIRNERMASYTQECVIIMQGALSVTIYDEDGVEVQEETLKAGDLIVLLSGGHSYEILESNTRVIECKNGPYLGVEVDKKNL